MTADFGEMNYQPREPGRKEIAEFFRLALIARLCSPKDIVRWAEKIIAEDEHPHISFIELSLAEGCPTEKFITLLLDIPGEASSYPVGMLLGHAFRMSSSGRVDSKTLILNLYNSSKVVSYSDHIENNLIGLEDEVSLVAEGICGSMEKLESDLSRFLSEWKSTAPPIDLVSGYDHEG